MFSLRCVLSFSCLFAGAYCCLDTPTQYVTHLQSILNTPTTEPLEVCPGRRLGTRTQVLSNDGNPDTLKYFTHICVYFVLNVSFCCVVSEEYFGPLVLVKMLLLSGSLSPRKLKETRKDLLSVCFIMLASRILSWTSTGSTWWRLTSVWWTLLGLR